MSKQRIDFQDISEGVYPLMANIERYLKNSGLPLPLLKLIKTRASQINGCGYCLDMHHKEALKAGESFERLYLLPAWEESPCYSDEEKAVLKLTDTLTKISDATTHDIEQAYALMAKYYDKEQIGNFVLTICQINTWNRMVITFGLIPGSYEVR